MTNVEQFRKIAQELGDLYEKKNLAYGNSFSDTYNKLGVVSAVTRISDKFNRLCNIATNPDIDNLGESLEDTLRDMASYCIMTVMELENRKPLLAECTITIPNDAPILAMLKDYDQNHECDQNTPIKRGQVFLCTKDVVSEEGNLFYKKDRVYISSKDNAIFDEEGDINHWWDGEDKWQDYFKRVKE